MYRSACALRFAELDEAIGDSALAIMHGATATRCNAVGDGTMVKNAIGLQHGSTAVAGVSGVLQCQAIAVCRNFEGRSLSNKRFAEACSIQDSRICLIITVASGWVVTTQDMHSVLQFNRLVVYTFSNENGIA